jgi:hypothetical protein
MAAAHHRNPPPHLSRLVASGQASGIVPRESILSDIRKARRPVAAEIVAAHLAAFAAVAALVVALTWALVPLARWLAAG